MQAEASCPKPAGRRRAREAFRCCRRHSINRTPFAASFLRNKISFFWHQRACRNQEWLPCLGSEFNAFLRKSHGDSRSFVYITWSRIRQDSQYQQEEVLHWASHLKHPQSIEFDTDRAPEKPDLNQVFQKGDDKEGERGRMTRKDNDFSPYTLVSLRTHLTVTSVYQPEEHSV